VGFLRRYEEGQWSADGFCSELIALRTSKVAGGASTKLTKIHDVRKGVRTECSPWRQNYSLIRNRLLVFSPS
jgi:hypothetical protein